MAVVRFSHRPARLAFRPLAGIPAFDDMERRMQKMMGNVLGDSDLVPSSIAWVPAMEIAETPNEMIASVELPGIQKKDVEISVDEDMLTISGEKTAEKTTDDKKYHLWERSYGSFSRSFSLPRGIDSARITAEFNNGVLNVHMPKTSGARAKARKIDIAAK
jgi:HSP20 family protein